LGNLNQPPQGFSEISGIHYHCPEDSTDCNWATRRISELKTHWFARHCDSNEVEMEGSEVQQVGGKKRDSQRLQLLSSKQDKRPCIHCGVLLHPESLRRHAKTFHTQSATGMLPRVIYVVHEVRIYIRTAC
jgi:hypothetical protein